MALHELTEEERDKVFDAMIKLLGVERKHPSKKELEEEIIDYLSKKHPCSLATCGKDGMPRISVVDYISEGLIIYIMSEGGGVLPSFAIYDTMQYMTCPIATYCVGYAFSAGAFLLSSGTKGRRFSLPSARIMIHQPWCEGIEGSADDLKIEQKQADITKRMFLNYLCRNTGKKYDDMEGMCQRDVYFLPNEAKNFGLIDKIITKKK